jgi:signal transduction histidine kinase
VGGPGGRGRGRPGRPPWWPEGEPWPPAGGDWRGSRTRFLRRVGCFAGGFLLLVFVAGVLAAKVFGGGGWERSGPPWPLGPLFGLLLLVLVFGVVGRIVRRTAGPIGDVMEAADRVAGGDYGVRVPERGGEEVRRLAASFNAMTARLAANEAQRRALLADVAHELRTPLSVIRGNVEGMLDEVYPRDDEHLEPLLDETAVMARLLDDLRTLSTAEAGALRLHREPTDAAALVEEVVAAFAPRARAAGLALSTEVGAIPELDVDPVRVREVLENLIANALRHTPRGGAIRVSVSAEDKDVSFAVADTGTGIAPADLPGVFDRYTKAVDSGGTGLGLAIAKRLVEAHGGGIEAASEAGRGTTIRFTLPVDQA